MAAGTRRTGGDTRIVSTGNSDDEDDLELLRQAALRTMANKKMDATDSASNDGYNSASSSSTEYEEISLNSPPEQSYDDHRDFCNESSDENSDDKESFQTCTITEEDEADSDNSTENVNSNSKVESLTITVENDDDDSEYDDSNVDPVEVDSHESNISIDSNDDNNGDENDNDNNDGDVNDGYDDGNDDNVDNDAGVNQSFKEDSEEELRIVQEDEMSDDERSVSEVINDIIDLVNDTDVVTSDQDNRTVCTVSEEPNNGILASKSLKQSNNSVAKIAVNVGTSVASKTVKENLLTQNKNKDKDKNINSVQKNKIIASKVSVVTKDPQKMTNQSTKSDTKGTRSSATKQTEGIHKQKIITQQNHEKLNQSKTVKNNRKDLASKSKTEKDKTEPQSAVVVTQQIPVEEDQLSIGGSSSESCDELDEELRKSIDLTIKPKTTTKKTSNISSSHKRSRSRSPNVRHRGSTNERNSLINNRGRHYLTQDRHTSRNGRLSNRSKSPVRRNRSPLGRTRKTPSPVRRERSTRRSRSPLRRDRHPVRKARSPLRSRSPQRSSNTLRRGRRCSHSNSPITRHRSQSMEKRLKSFHSPSRLRGRSHRSRTPIKRKSSSPIPDKNKIKKTDRNTVDKSKQNDVKVKSDISSQAKGHTQSPSETKSVSSTKENSVVQKTLKSEKKDVSVSKKVTNVNKEKKVVLDKLDARNLLSSKKPVAIIGIKKVKPATQPKTLDDNTDDLRHIIKQIPASEPANPQELKERELDARIAKIRQKNLDILKRNMEIEKEKELFG